MGGANLGVVLLDGLEEPFLAGVEIAIRLSRCGAPLLGAGTNQRGEGANETVLGVPVAALRGHDVALDGLRLGRRAGWRALLSHLQRLSLIHI